MLRTALLRGRGAVVTTIHPRGTRQWLIGVDYPKSSSRAFADKDTRPTNTKASLHDSDTVVLPGSQSQTSKGPTPPAPGPITSASPLTASSSSSPPNSPSSDTTIPPENVPRTPLPTPSGKTQTAPPTSIPSPATRDADQVPSSTVASGSTSPPVPPPPPPPPRKPRRFRRSILALLMVIGLSYAGGVWYSLVSDNFHDFFTEYIPFGEDAVLYFEEREFRKRFPSMTKPTTRPSPRASDTQITIPSKSGLSWKITEDDGKGSDPGPKVSRPNAPQENKGKAAAETAQQTPETSSAGEKTTAVESAKTGSSFPRPNSSTPSRQSQTDSVASTEKRQVSESSRGSKKNPEVNEPSVYVPITRIDPLAVPNADEPLVQELVKTFNDIITVINADSTTGKFASTISKAKAELASVGSKIIALKNAGRKEADEKVKSKEIEFDGAARELVRRLEEEIRGQEAQWKDEFESERERISQSYQERLKSEIERLKQVADQDVHNRLLEQAVALKKQFISEITDRVETERNGRLSKLSQLSTSVNELEDLTSEWNSIIEANLKTQHLQVAVEAVRSSLEQADRPRPFVKELAALKEIATNDPVVNAAIASINPMAYQRGVPTSAQLIDRFRRVAAEVRKASLLPDDAGVASHAASFLLSKVLFKKQGMTVGDDVESILTRTETLLEEGSLDDAAREMNGLTGWAKTLSSDWLGEVRRVLEVRQALEVVSSEVRMQSLKVD